MKDNPLHYDTTHWIKSDMQVFWGEIAPSEHVVQIYEDDQAFLDLLLGFVSGGIKAGDGVIVIATASHLKGLKAKLQADGFDLFALALADQYISLDAEECLSSFVVNGWPDENLFRHFITGIISRSRRNHRHIRAFGEMVALLWAQGHSGATVKLEHLWNEFCQTESFCLFCAYPKSGFTQNANESLNHICGSHSKMISEFGRSKTEMLYKNMEKNAI